MEYKGRTRARKKGKKKIKTAVKIGVTLLIIVLIASVYFASKLYSKKKLEKSRGKVSSESIHDKDRQDDLSEQVDPELKYWILSAGAGECIYIKVGSKDIIIDAGDDASGESIVKELKPEISGNVEYLILTSNSNKSTGGAKEIYKNFNVEKTVYGKFSKQDIKKLKKMSGKKCEFVRGADTTLDLDNKIFLTLAMPEVASKSDNNKSIMTILTYGDTVFVQESDAGAEEEAKLEGLVTRADVIVMAQHGDSSVNRIADKLSARYVIASTNKESTLPSRELIEYIKSNIYTTYNSGTIKFISDGKKVESNLESKDQL